MKAWSVIKTILSGFIWGIGQVFNKQYIKALFFFIFFAVFVTLELVSSNYFYEEKYENEIPLSKIKGNSLGEWYHKALFQQYDVQILNNNRIESFDNFLEEIGVEEKDPFGYYAGPTGRDNPTAKLFTEDRFIEFFAKDLKEASFLRYTEFGTTNVIRAEDFNRNDAKRLITLENTEILWDEINNKFYLPLTNQNIPGQEITEYFETNPLTRIDNPNTINNIEGLSRFRKTGKLFKEGTTYYVEVFVNTENRMFLELNSTTFNLVEPSPTFVPIEVTNILGQVFELNGVLYEYYEPGLIHNGVRAQYKQTPFSNLFRRAMVQGNEINPINDDDYVKLMVRVYMELNPEFKAQYFKDFDNFFYDHAGMFLKGYWEVITLGQAKGINLNNHLALADAMVGRKGEPAVSNMGPNITYEGEVTVGGHVSTLLLLDGLIMVILSLFFFIFGIWSMIDTWKVSEEKRLSKKTMNTKEYFKSVWDNGFEYIILSPAMFVLAFISIMPIVFGFILAFTSIGGTLSMRGLFDWVGFRNFLVVFDPNSVLGQGFGTAFWRVLGWTLIWAILSTVTVFFGGFFQALILNAESVVFRKLWRTLLILPWAIPALLSQMVFSVMFKETGYINQLLMQMGIYDIFKDWGILGKAYNQVEGFAKYFWLGHDNIMWFTNENNPNFVKGVIIVLNIWLGFPYFMALMTGIMTAIDKSLYEAADIDGATGFQKLRQITMPLVLYSTAPILIMTFSGNFNNFGVIYFITGGGPGDLNNVNNGFAGQTDILISWMYRLTTEHQIYNLASVFSVLIFIFVGSITAWNLSRTKAFQED
ncbi:carbohydrate ABC transporter permease [Acholeplasma granularum]|uniref:carbohydrate ABC transporter permease n=1 Tax=Acholeplasma granularum TaxID=264635 RepID=UPI0004711B4D|nr:sugar ABC transporter permease [Acholeplasma granularum]